VKSLNEPVSNTEFFTQLQETAKYSLYVVEEGNFFLLPLSNIGMSQNFRYQ
jgi:hypothetical protein